MNKDKARSGRLPFQEVKKRPNRSSRLKRPSPSPSSFLVPVPAKRQRKKEEIQLVSLPSRALERILHHCSLQDIGSLGRTCRILNQACLSYVLSPASTETIFPFLISSQVSGLTESQLQQSSETVVMVLSQPFTLIPGPASNIRRKFELLGRVVKKLTCLMPTVERITFLCSLISRVDFEVTQESHFVKNRTLFAWIGTLLHSFVRGWVDRECERASSLLVTNMREKGDLDTLLKVDYIPGTRLSLEICYRQYWVNLYHSEVTDSHQVWLEFLLRQTAGDNTKLMARVLLIMATPAKEDITLPSYGLQWSDHMEAIPANWNVANSRYARLVKLLYVVRKGRLGSKFNNILQAVFTCPGKWLPENIGGVLLLLGEEVTSHFLQYICHQTCQDCREKLISDVIIGLAVMTVR